MKRPYQYIRLYRKDIYSEDDVSYTGCGVDKFDRFSATVDLEQVYAIEASYIDKSRVTVMETLGGTRILALVSYPEMLVEFYDYQLNFIYKQSDLPKVMRKQMSEKAYTALMAIRCGFVTGNLPKKGRGMLSPRSWRIYFRILCFFQPKWEVRMYDFLKPLYDQQN